MCLVEIEKQRGLQPACTFPVTEGMVVATEQRARRGGAQVRAGDALLRAHPLLHVLPDERQRETRRLRAADAGLQYGLTTGAMRRTPRTPGRSTRSRKYFVMDHSRCILCRRCIRACDEIAANHTLGVRERGARTMIIADMDVPFGESSCVSCGTCLQVCPTGALIDRRSAYMGRDRRAGAQADHLHGLLRRLRHRGRRPQQPAAAGRGRLGRAERRPAVRRRPLRDGRAQPKRVTSPMIRRDGEWVKATWDEATDLVAGKLKAAGQGRRPGLAPRDQRDARRVQAPHADVLGSDQIGLLYGAAPQDLGPKASLADVAGADCIVLVGGDPLDDQKVIGYMVKRAVDLGATLTIVADGAEPARPVGAEAPADERARRRRHDRGRCRAAGRALCGGPVRRDLRVPARPAREGHASCRWSRARTPLGAARQGSRHRRSPAMRSSSWPPTRSRTGTRCRRPASPWCRPLTDADGRAGRRGPPVPRLDRTAGPHRQHGRPSLAVQPFLHAAGRRAGGRCDPGRARDPACGNP